MLQHDRHPTHTVRVIYCCAATPSPLAKLAGQTYSRLFFAFPIVNLCANVLVMIETQAAFWHRVLLRWEGMTDEDSTSRFGW